MSRLKVLHIGIALAGIDTYMRTLIGHLDVDKIETIVIRSKIEDTPPLLDSNNKHVKEYKFFIRRKINYFYDSILLYNIVRTIKTEKPDLLHVHSSKCGIIGRIAGYITDTKTVYTPNAFSYLSARNKITKWIYKGLEKYTIFKNTYFLGSSFSELEMALDEINYNKNRSFYANNSINTITNIYKRQFNYNNSIMLSTIGRPSYQKNTLMLVEVLNILKKDFNNIILNIIGVGHYSPDIEKLKFLISETNLNSNIKVYPWLNKLEVLQLLEKSYCYVSTSRYEGLSYAILEAMSLGLPIIATNVAGNRDAVKHNYSGFLIENFDVNEMANKIKLVIQDNKLHRDLANNTIKYFSENFDINSTIKDIENIYLEIHNSNN